MIFLICVSDTSSFAKIEKKYCKNHYHNEDTLQRAIDRCNADENCKMFYSNTCNDEGPYRFCENFSDWENSTSKTCLYMKEGKFSNIYYIISLEISMRRRMNLNLEVIFKEASQTTEKMKHTGGCYQLTSEECCKYKDARINTPYYQQPCVVVMRGSNVGCEPLCFATNQCDDKFSGAISDYCGRNGKKRVRKFVREDIFKLFFEQVMFLISLN